MKEIAVKGRCDLNCVFCNYSKTYNPVDIDKHYKSILRKISNTKDQEITLGVYNYEPTTFPRFLEVVSHARKLNKNITLQTSGVLLSEKEYVRKLIKTGISKVKITIASYDNKSSEVMYGRSDIFKKKLNSIKNCTNLGLKVEPIILLLNMVHPNLCKIVKKIDDSSKSCATEIGLIFPQPSMGRRNSILIPPLTSVIPDVLNVCKQNHNLNFFLKGIPICLVGSESIPTNLNISAPNNNLNANTTNSYLSSCSSCKNKGTKCNGISKGYLEIYGAEELTKCNKVINKTTLSRLRRNLSELGSPISKIKKEHLILELNSLCNNNCIYCYLKNKKENGKGFSFFKKNILGYSKNKQKEITNIDFTGGEPTLYPNLTSLISYAKNLGYPCLTLVTNGRRLAYKKYCRDIINAGINRVIISLDGQNKKIAESITNSKGSFNQTIEAINNVKKHNCELGITIVINSKNFIYLGEISKKAYSLGADFISFQYILPHIKDKHIDCRVLDPSIIPPYQETRIHLIKAINTLEGKVPISVHFVPFCFLKGYERLIIPDSDKTDRVAINYRGFKYNIGEHLIGAAKKKKSCKGCSYNNSCIGIFKSYSKELGTNMME